MFTKEGLKEYSFIQNTLQAKKSEESLGNKPLELDPILANTKQTESGSAMEFVI